MYDMSGIKKDISKFLEGMSITTSFNGGRLFALVTATMIGLSLTLLIARGSFPTPSFDEFYLYRLYFDAKNGDINLSEIFKPHFTESTGESGHVYVLLHSWFWLIVHYGIDLRISMYMQVALVVVAILFISEYVLSRASKNIGLVVVLSVAFVLGSARQWENLYWAMQISAASMLLSSILAFYYVARHSETQRNTYAGIACIFALIALLSNGGGLVTFLITTIALIAVSKQRYVKTIGIFVCVVGAVVAGVVSYVLPPRQVCPGSSLVDVGNVFNYSLAFFSNALFSFSERGDDIYSLLTATAVILVTVYAVTSSWSQKETNVFPYLFICFSVISCIVIAYTRLNCGIWQPNAPRYYPFVAMMLVGNMLILGDAKNKVQKHIVLIAFVLIAISFVYSYVVEWGISPYRYIYFKNAHVSLCSGSTDGLAFRDNLRYTDTTVMKEIFCTNQDLQRAETKSQPVLKEIGPVQTNRNTPFNQQPDGESALWMITENCENSCILVFSDRDIPVVVNQDGILTAKIPKELYASPGKKTVYIKNIHSGKKSQIFTFHVN